MAKGEDVVTRGEFELLRTMVTDNRLRLETIDATGTRGVGALQIRMDDFISSFADFKLEVSNDFKDHITQHEKEKEEHQSNRRWAIGVIVTIITAIGGLYPILILAVNRGH